MKTSYLMECLQEALDAKRLHDQAYDQHSGICWGEIDGQWLVEAAQHTQNNFELAMSDYIDERIAMARDGA